MHIVCSIITQASSQMRDCMGLSIDQTIANTIDLYMLKPQQHLMNIF